MNRIGVARVYMVIHWLIAFIAFAILGILAFSPMTHNVMFAIGGAAIGYICPYFILNSKEQVGRFSNLFMRAPFFVGLGMVWYDVSIGLGGYWMMMYFQVFNPSETNNPFYAIGAGFAAPTITATVIAIVPFYFIYWLRSGVVKLCSWVADGFKQ